jgi:hypothetical protein
MSAIGWDKYAKGAGIFFGPNYAAHRKCPKNMPAPFAYVLDTAPRRKITLFLARADAALRHDAYGWRFALCGGLLWFSLRLHRNLKRNLMKGGLSHGYFGTCCSVKLWLDLL